MEPRVNRFNSNKRQQRKAINRYLKQVYILIFATFILMTAYYLVNHSFHKEIKQSDQAIHHVSKIKPIQKQSVSNRWTKDMNNNPAIDQYLKSLNFNGTVLVVKDNKVMLNKGYGYADFEKKLPNNSDTVFFLGSITKVFISTAIIQLQEQGKVKVSDPLSKYIPDFPNGNQITLFHLLTHTSGIPEHSEGTQKISHSDLIKKIENGKLKFPPGTNWNYSDSNYAILGYIVEKIANEPLDMYVKKHIFTVAGMKHTGFGDMFYTEPFPAKGYKLQGNNMISPSLPDMSQLFGCGDIYTTAYDMYLFDKALYTGKLLNEESLKQFFTPFKHNYAFGLYNDPGSYSDHGVLPGWNVLNSFGKNGRKYVVLLSNIQNRVKSLGMINNQIYLMLKNDN